MNFVFAPAAVPAIPVVGSADYFPVHRIYCVGRNYAEHAKEMGDSGREAPFFFSKPADAVLPVAAGARGCMPYPSRTKELHHEVELVVALSSGGSHITLADAASHIWGYAVGLDMTRRDLQAQAKQGGRPWCTAKGFDHSAPIGALTRCTDLSADFLTSGSLDLQVNGIERQRGRLDQMIWQVAEIIVELSQLYQLQAGDLIFTGTPAGVASVVRGDLLTAQVDGLATLTVELV
ncbi:MULTISPECIES: fumarylacetoacetate hydrolase family protein [unclassified Undibacterium]|uniref:fumarylacetoacetate hydrolase family protein n=1 Tax=unclassified Undibacterium TaxID=2630295 RepID=UPI002AC930AC|nr:MULTISPECIES: fumarylacetoacetate hydrolase family protein [unclassified Undibacterium]MEB0139198.1 fumarylacetoacetate hydrolase family protein [Undibacterium sp. CCC2.1]MEB0172227.1 fumarylacetoacetate hydrolase family protein [Undibacterium sp. CCC1.1]MEB0175916.1 fumarylacetoacetate hydrolase family protein [Undibacterium sp. CCC3.4]MEB0215224.1 fumarylacetoacetate hydrolase family protein [Undibacterium sp. 5I2]WPX43522.1 fumarylacetoacetate hydrolase family protein [Undibacterium sp. 